MSAIKIECPHCQKVIEGDESLYGQTLKCPQCQGELVVPQRPAGPGPKLARLVSGPEPAAAPPGPAEPVDEEKEIFRIVPTILAHCGALVLGTGLILLGIVMAILVPVMSWPATIAFLAAIPVIAGLLCLLRVWLKLKSFEYRLTTQRLLVSRGLIGREVDELELYRVKDVTVDQDFLGRVLNYGTIVVVAADSSTPQVELTGVAQPVQVKETLRTQFRAARHREGMRPTEFIDTTKL